MRKRPVDRLENTIVLLLGPMSVDRLWIGSSLIDTGNTLTHLTEGRRMLYFVLLLASILYCIVTCHSVSKVNYRELSQWKSDVKFNHIWIHMKKLNVLLMVSCPVTFPCWTVHGFSDLYEIGQLTVPQGQLSNFMKSLIWLPNYFSNYSN